MKRLTFTTCLLYMVLSVLGTTVANGQQDYFTEQFSSGTNPFDLSNKAIMFTPTADGTSYSACLQQIAQLPTNPAGGIDLEMPDDDYELVSLPEQKTVFIYGSSFSSFYIGSNGYITFTEADWDHSQSLSDHFDTKRISALFNDFDPSTGGVVSWKQIANGVAVTWGHVAEYDTGGSSTFQVEMYFDGRIRLAWLGVTAQQGIVGLSKGLGLPADFQQTNLSAYSPCGGGPSIPPIISGYVRTAGGSGISDVLLVFSNYGGSTTTDSSGYYSNAVSHGWSGVVTPSKSGYAFNPPSISYSNVTSDISGQNYTGSTGPPTGLPVEWFSSSADRFDLSNKAIMFTPTAGGTSYDACLYGINQLPTDSVGDSDWEPLDDDFMFVHLSDQKTVSIFGSSFSSFYVGTNGYITFTGGHAEHEESVSTHFNTKRISALFRDLDPSAGGAVSWIQLADRVAVTWRDVPEYDTGGSNTFQVEMYFDGRILLAWLSVTAQQGIVGLSDGLGLPADFHEIDFSECPLCGGQVIGSSITPIAYWTMDDNAANTAVLDSSGSGNHGTARRNTSTLSTAGKIDSALRFNGVNDYINCGNNSSLNLTDNFTIAAWIKPRSFSWLAGIVSKYHTPNADSYFLRLNRDSPYNKLEFGGKGITRSDVVTSSSALNANQWYFVVAMRDSGTGKIYINGSLNASAPILISSSADSLHIGMDYGDHGDARYFNGEIDNVMIFNRTLSETEIKALYIQSVGSKEFWRYEGKFTRSDALKDYSDGTYTITTHYKDGSQCQTTAWFGIPNSSDAIPQLTQKPVLTFPKHNSRTTSPVAFTWEPCKEANATSIALRLEKQDSTGEHIDIEAFVDSTGSEPIELSPEIWNAKLFCNRWYDYNNPDGIALEVGKYSESDYSFEVLSGLVAHWKMNDNAATTTVVDSSGTGNHGTARRNTAALSTAGKIDSALRFNGVNDYINCGNNSSLNLTDNFTIAAWIKPRSFSWLAGIVSKYHTPNADSYFLRLNRNSPYNKLEFGGKGITRSDVVTSSSALNANQWYFVVAMRDSGTGKIYINGSLNASAPILISSSADSLYIGMDYGDHGDARYFNGEIDNVMIFNRTLSGTEITALYNKGAGP